MKRSRNTLGPLIGYHGCDSSVAEAVLSGRRKLQPSQNDYDWLGPGIYFWVDSPERGLNWAREQAARKSHKVKAGARSVQRLRAEIRQVDYGARVVPWLPGSGRAARAPRHRLAVLGSGQRVGSMSR